MKINYTKIVKIDLSNLGKFERELVQVGKLLAKGYLAVIPTETVYGLATNIYLEDAVLRVYKVKERPLTSPLIVLVNSMKMLEEVVDYIPEEIIKNFDKIWPGPLTIILPKSKSVPSIVTANQDNVAVRIPSHVVTLKLIEYANTPLTGPSANKSGKPSPVKIDYAIDDLFGEVDIFIDCGETPIGIESTIIDFTKKPPKLIRPGPFSIDEIESILNVKVETLPVKHDVYSEKTYTISKPIYLLNCLDTSKLLDLIVEVIEDCFKKKLRPCLLLSEETSKLLMGKYPEITRNVEILVLGQKLNPTSIAKNLFTVLRRFEELNVDVGFIECFEEKGIGYAIMNRIRRACGSRVISC